MVSTTKRHGIIVGIDGSPESDAAVNWAAHDAAIRGLPLTVVHVESPAAATWSQAAVLEESPSEQLAGAAACSHTRRRSPVTSSPILPRYTSLANYCLPLPPCRRSSSNPKTPNSSSSARAGAGHCLAAFSAQSALDSSATHTAPLRLFGMTIRSCRIPHRVRYSWESTARPQTSPRQSRSRKRHFVTPS